MMDFRHDRERERERERERAVTRHEGTSEQTNVEKRKRGLDGTVKSFW